MIYAIVSKTQSDQYHYHHSLFDIDSCFFFLFVFFLPLSKTTTISMLSGLIPSSSGSANIYGRDMETEMSAIRTVMGICPQHGQSVKPHSK